MIGFLVVESLTGLGHGRAPGRAMLTCHLLLFRGVAMALTEQDREYIREVAINSAGEVSKRVIENVLKWHIDACPHGKTILASKWGLLGLCIGSGVSGAGFFAALLKLFSG